MAMKNDFSLYDLPYKKVYVVTGPSDKLAWELRHCKNLEVIVSIKSRTLLSLLSSPSLDVVKKTFLVLHTSTLKLPDDLYIWDDYRCFIYINSFDKNLSASQKKFYSHYSGGVFTQVNLWDRTYIKDPDIQKHILINLTKENQFKVAAISEAYDHNPLKLNRVLRDLTLIDNETVARDTLVLREFITNLACPNPDYKNVVALSKLPRTILNTYFTAPIPYCKFFKLTVSSQRSYDLSLECRSLWLWYEIFLNRIPNWYFANASYLVKLFFTWVYNSNRRWSVYRSEGFTSYYSRGKKAYLFQPSEKAIEEFYRIVS